MGCWYSDGKEQFINIKHNNTYYNDNEFKSIIKDGWLLDCK